jgi:hypothetical protein
LLYIIYLYSFRIINVAGGIDLHGSDLRTHLILMVTCGGNTGKRKSRMLSTLGNVLLSSFLNCISSYGELLILYIQIKLLHIYTHITLVLISFDYYNNIYSIDTHDK